MDLRRRRKLLKEYARYFFNNGVALPTLRRFEPSLIARAYDFGYIHWPKQIEQRVKGRNLLDVGCGMGLHGVGFVLAGARSYTGCDPIVDLDSDVVKNGRKGQREPCGWSPRMLMRQFPQLQYVTGTIADVRPGCTFDVVTLHNATEHLIGIADVFVSVLERLKPRGLLIFNHHNFYAWNGHHLAPKTVDAIDLDHPQHQKVVDWAHLTPGPELSSYFSTRVNRITLDQLRALTEQHFAIEEWDEVLSSESQGRSRLTAEIMARHPQLTRRDLETQSVYCVACKR